MRLGTTAWGAYQSNTAFAQRIGLSLAPIRQEIRFGQLTDLATQRARADDKPTWSESEPRHLERWLSVCASVLNEFTSSGDGRDIDNVSCWDAFAAASAMPSSPNPTSHREIMKAYQIIEIRYTTLQRITAVDPSTGRTITFHWEDEVPPTQYDLACRFADAERIRIGQWKRTLGVEAMGPRPPIRRGISSKSPRLRSSCAVAVL